MRCCDRPLYSCNLVYQAVVSVNARFCDPVVLIKGIDSLPQRHVLVKLKFINSHFASAIEVNNAMITGSMRIV